MSMRSPGCELATTFMACWRVNMRSPFDVRQDVAGAQAGRRRGTADAGDAARPSPSMPSSLAWLAGKSIGSSTPK